MFSVHAQSESDLSQRTSTLHSALVLTDKVSEGTRDPLKRSSTPPPSPTGTPVVPGPLRRSSSWNCDLSSRPASIVEPKVVQFEPFYDDKDLFEKTKKRRDRFKGRTKKGSKRSNSYSGIDTSPQVSWPKKGTSSSDGAQGMATKRKYTKVPSFRLFKKDSGSGGDSDDPSSPRQSSPLSSPKPRSCAGHSGSGSQEEPQNILRLKSLQDITTGGKYGDVQLLEKYKKDYNASKEITLDGPTSFKKRTNSFKKGLVKRSSSMEGPIALKIKKKHHNTKDSKPGQEVVSGESQTVLKQKKRHNTVKTGKPVSSDSYDLQSRNKQKKRHNSARAMRRSRSFEDHSSARAISPRAPRRHSKDNRGISLDGAPPFSKIIKGAVKTGIKVTEEGKKKFVSRHKGTDSDRNKLLSEDTMSELSIDEQTWSTEEQSTNVRELAKPLSGSGAEVIRTHIAQSDPFISQRESISDSSEEVIVESGSREGSYEIIEDLVSPSTRRKQTSYDLMPSPNHHVPSPNHRVPSPLPPWDLSPDFYVSTESCQLPQLVHPLDFAALSAPQNSSGELRKAEKRKLTGEYFKADTTSFRNSKKNESFTDQMSAIKLLNAYCEKHTNKPHTTVDSSPELQESPGLGSSGDEVLSRPRCATHYTSISGSDGHACDTDDKTDYEQQHQLSSDYFAGKIPVVDDDRVSHYTYMEINHETSGTNDKFKEDKEHANAILNEPRTGTHYTTISAESKHNRTTRNTSDAQQPQDISAPHDRLTDSEQQLLAMNGASHYTGLRSPREGDADLTDSPYNPHLFLAGIEAKTKTKQSRSLKRSPLLSSEKVEKAKKKLSNTVSGIPSYVTDLIPQTAKRSHSTDSLMRGTGLPEIDPTELSLCEKIGSGCSGDVYKAVYYHQEVAVKRVAGSLRDSLQDTFFNEAVRLSFNSVHPCIVRFFGVCVSKSMGKSDEYMIVTELADHGNLQTFLQTNGPDLSLSILLEFAKQVSSGMCFLEKQNFLHLDLAARNVLVFSASRQGFQAKISDFGLAREAQVKTKAQNSTRIAFKQTPPEVFTHAKITSKCDVWSYGVLLWELMTLGEEPYPNWTQSMVEHFVCSGKRLEKPQRCPDEIYQLMLNCWAH
eukprot:CAMPEP_0174266444 /NCGR_PEP_ID=MMETSP0439-20130205/30231_1 /TAXON_ID=0 /ORGANISM="Stereomyxa ramosa, Strain Chinc5" /LENGTH=1115 /DNA_ID=CAMNT_0015353407 /DNA_START=22 /DNA_END=3366 /DNA_ORIENTATION=+